MTKNSKLVGSILTSFFEGYTLDENNELKVVNERAAESASTALSELVLEQAREWWDHLEASEDSLTAIADAVSFEELNTDPSSMGSDSSPTPGGSSDSTPTLESLLGDEDFDLDSILEMDDHLMMDDKGRDDDIVDGAEDFDDLKMGLDDEGMGDEESMIDDGEVSDDKEMIGGDEGDMDMDMDMGMDDEGEDIDDIEMDLGMGDEDGDLGDIGDEFDFDLDNMDDDDDDVDEMFGSPKSMNSTMSESDDDDDDDKDDSDDDHDDEDEEDDK